MSRAFLVSAALAVLAPGCGGGDDDGATPDSGPNSDAAADAGWSSAPALPMAVANNAVASVDADGSCAVFSVLGITGGFAFSDITSAAFRWNESDASWQAIDDAPGPARVAANAVGIAGNLYVIGGYTVAANGAEASSDRLDRYNLATEQWEPRAPIPTPIDDTVALAWLDRYIIVVSGWSDTANVDLVQIYDTVGDSWSAGTPFPGTAAFGHAGGITDNTMIIIDGAASTPGFPLVNQAWSGTLDPQDVGTIAWQDLGAHPGPGRYRAAGTGKSDGSIFLHGGTSTPYNFDGLRYDNNQPAEPLATTLLHGPNGFSDLPEDKPSATMDHRSMARCGDRVYSVGGMTAGPAATTDVWRFTSPEES